jgi:hypothetical protein
LVLIIATIVGFIFVNRFGPYYWDYWKMKEVTKTTALQWRVYSKKAAVEKLQHMLSLGEFGDDYIDPAFCSLEDLKSSLRVSCYWEVDVEYPFSDRVRTLVFTTEHIETLDGS